jgi:hypothetical protein
MLVIFRHILLLSIFLASPCCATPIVFTHTGTSSGTLNGGAFANTSFIITGQADTSHRVNSSSGFSLDLDSAQITLTGLGTFAITTPTREFYAFRAGIPIFNGLPVVGFSRVGVSGTDLVDGPASASLASWNMLSSIGPINGLGAIFQWNSTPVLTSGGQLILNDGNPQLTYQATVAPEPSAQLTLISLVFLVPGARLRKRF